MSGEAVKRQQIDEDTFIGFLGHMTPQAGDGTEQVPDDRNRQQRGPERTPNQPDRQDQRREKKPNRNNRK